ncbi:hypothetical protein [Staphylococcus phage vB_SauM-V1SA19]|nr:hypothetical protein [Staphylococcus phage vB_SauM-V1SA19]
MVTYRRIYDSKYIRNITVKSDSYTKSSKCYFT